MSMRMALATVALLGAASAANAAVLFTTSGTLLPSDGFVYLSAPNLPVGKYELNFALSRTLGTGESLSLGVGYAITDEYYLDGILDNYDFDFYYDTLDFAGVSSGWMEILNQYWSDSWVDPDFGTYTHIHTVQAEDIALDYVQIFTPLDYVLTITGAVPEPATWGLMIAGFGLVGVAMRRQARAIA